MKYVLPLAVVAALAATPVLAQSSRSGYPAADGLQQSELAPEQDVLVAVERKLSQLGYSTSPGGQYDAQLRNSVLRFQSDNGLRPTGNVDLSTLAALGIDVDVAGSTSRSTAMTTTTDRTRRTTVTEDQTAALVDDGSVDFPLFKDEHMSAPTTSLNEGDRFENQTGVPQPRSVTRSGDIPGLPPGFPREDLIH